MTKVWLQLIIYSNTSFRIGNAKNWERINHEIVKNLHLSDILVMSISCEQNHFHFLIYLNEHHSISEITKILKSITLNKLKKEQIIDSDFIWEDEYFALSVSPSLVEKERYSISSQHQVHQNKSLKDEIEMLLNEGTEKYESLSNSAILSDFNFSEIQKQNGT